MTGRAVVMFSGGIASWAAARRALELFDVVRLLFTDTGVEDEDLYRFLDDAAVDVGVELVRIADGRTIWQVFRDERYLGNSRVDPCSRILKRELARRWMTDNEPDATVVLGLDWSEVHRLERSRVAWQPWDVAAPLIDKPYRLRSELLADAVDRGLEPPRLYGLGFAHNNCGGGCVKAGAGAFRHLLEVLPDRFAEWEQGEAGMREYLGRPVTILPGMTLAQLREATPDPGIPLWGGCECFA